jgi:tetratricopeptide (TPR) repeat protein
MARTIVTAALIVLIYTCAGCTPPDSGESQLIPPHARVAIVTEQVRGGEADIIEQMAADRQAYRNSLASLVDYYRNSGNSMKLTWAEKELNALDDMPQYTYIVEAVVAGADLRATDRIADAELMYRDAWQTERDARRLVVVVDDDLLRLALDKYNNLIRSFPTSDKIDDAAYRAAGILEHYRDYTLALMYYQRTYQWDPETSYPARYKAAYILDTRMGRNAEALELYQEFVKTPGVDAQLKVFAEARIRELTKSEKPLKED